MKWSTLVAAGALIFMGCSDDDNQEGGASGGRATDALVDCSELFVEGNVLSAEDAIQQCRTDDGSSASGTVTECVDGKVRISFTAGDPDLWGFVDEPLRPASTGENDTDPEFVKLTDLC